MPLAAPKPTIDEYSYLADEANGSVSTATGRRSSTRAQAGSSRPHRNYQHVARARRDIEDYNDRDYTQQTPDVAQRPSRSRARRTHKPLRWSFSMTAMGGILLAQLMILLWIKSLALSAMHRSDELGDATSGEIARVNEEIAQTQKRIAALSSPTQLKKWADARGWRMSTQSEFDDVTKLTPLSPQPDSSTHTEGAAANEQ